MKLSKNEVNAPYQPFNSTAVFVKSYRYRKSGLSHLLAQLVGRGALHLVSTSVRYPFTDTNCFPLHSGDRQTTIKVPSVQLLAWMIREPDTLCRPLRLHRMRQNV